MVISLFGITVNDFPEGQRNVSSVLQGLGEQIAVSRALSSHIPEPQHSVLSLAGHGPKHPGGSPPPS